MYCIIGDVPPPDVDEISREQAPPAAGRRTLRDRWFLLLAALVLLAIAGGGAWVWRQQAAARKASAQTPAANTEGEIAAGAELSFAGLVAARNVLPIPAPLDGVIEQVEVDVGSSVEQEQPLARIKNDGLATAHKQAKEDLERAIERTSTLESSLIAARLEASRSAADSDRTRTDAERMDRNLKREEMLFREGATPRLKFEKAQKDAAAAASDWEAARLAATQAADKVTKLSSDLDALKRIVEEKTKEMEGAQADIDAAVVQAPVDGVIVAVKAKAGDEVSPAGNKDLFQIAVAPDELQIEIEPEPKQAERLKDGLPALIQLLELSLEGIPGELKRTDAGKWRIEFKAPDPVVKPGLSALVKVKLP